MSWLAVEKESELDGPREGEPARPIWWAPSPDRLPGFLRARCLQLARSTRPGGWPRRRLTMRGDVCVSNWVPRRPLVRMKARTTTWAKSSWV